MLADISLAVSPGDVLGVVGVNGAGKSTLLRTMAGILPPTGGRVELVGAELPAAPCDLRQRVGYLAEGCPMDPCLRVREYLRDRGSLKGLYGRNLRRRVRVVSTEFGLEHVRRRMAGVLSRGERQRVGLAELMLNEPSVLIMDEPLAGLDATQAHVVRHLIENISKNRAVVVSSHDLGVIKAVCNRVCILHDGVLIREGATDAVLREGLGDGVLSVDLLAVGPEAATRAVMGIEGVDCATASRFMGGRVSMLCRAGPSVAGEVGAALKAKGATDLVCEWRQGDFSDMLLLVSESAGAAEAES